MSRQIDAADAAKLESWVERIGENQSLERAAVEEVGMPEPGIARFAVDSAHRLECTDRMGSSAALAEVVQEEPALSSTGPSGFQQIFVWDLRLQTNSRYYPHCRQRHGRAAWELVSSLFGWKHFLEARRMEKRNRTWIGEEKEDAVVVVEQAGKGQDRRDLAMSLV